MQVMIFVCNAGCLDHPIKHQRKRFIVYINVLDFLVVVIEQFSLMREKLMAALHTADDVYCHTKLVLNIDAADVSPTSLKVNIF
jgi:hypothetical protein